MAKAGWQALIRKSGTSTSMTSEAMTPVGGVSLSQRWQITDSTKRAIDPETAFNLKVAGATVSYANLSAINFEFGEVTFAATPATTPLFNGSYLPLGTPEIVAEVKAFSLSESSDLLDKTVFTSSSRPCRKRMYGLADAEASLDILINSTDAPSLATLQHTGRLLCLEVISGFSARFRGFGRLSSYERSGSVDGLIEGSITWTLSATREETSGFIAGYSDRLLTSS